MNKNPKINYNIIQLLIDYNTGGTHSFTTAHKGFQNKLLLYIDTLIIYVVFLSNFFFQRIDEI